MNTIQPADLPALQQTAAPHLREGESLIGVCAANLDPLLPLYFYWEATREQLLWLPFRLLWDVVRTILWGLWSVLAPGWLVDLFDVHVVYRRRYGLCLFRRLYRTIRRPLHGGSWSGGKQSLAGQVWRAVRTTPYQRHLRIDHDRFTLVLTDQRLLVLSRETSVKAGDQAYPALLLLELLRGGYGSRPEVPDSWFTDRLDLTFADGSWIALDLPDKETVQRFSALLG